MNKNLAVASITAMLVIGFLCGSPSPAQKSLAQTLYFSGVEAYKKGNYLCKYL